MQMSEGEIVKSYKEARNKREQVQILAQLNACDPDVIKEILKTNGVDLRGGNYRAKVKTDVENPEEQTEVADRNVKIPEIIRGQLTDDLKKIKEEISVLIERKIAIENFLKGE